MRVCSPIQFVLVLAASTASLVHAHPAGSADATGKAPGCRYIPSDRQWPSASDWSALNRTTGGKLIATVPMAHVCHSDNNGTYDEAACNALKAPTVFTDGEPSYVSRLDLTLTAWDNSASYISHPAELQNPYYQNQSCDPFTPRDTPCRLGNYASYSLNVSGASDIQAGLKFAREKNIRLSVRNTGHDYNGKSSGYGSLSLWTHNMKTMQIIDDYTSTTYNGPAIKLGAGVAAGEALVFATSKGYRVVTGECGTVGISGGYTQGGGHGPLNGAYGLGADQTLEFELITGEGKHIIATPDNNHSEIYWALSGGGGGTYGVVISMTSRIYKDGPVTGPLLAFTAPEVGNDTFWKAIGVFYKHLPAILQNNTNSAQFNTWNDNFGAIFVFPDQGTENANRTLGPLLSELDSIGMPYTFQVSQAPNYREYYDNLYGPLPYGLEPPSTSLNSRIIPAWVVKDPAANAKLIDAIKLSTNTGEFHVACSAADLNQHRRENAVLPAWRSSIAACNMVVFWDWTAPLSTNLEKKSRMVNDYAPAWDAATPGSGVYLNEIDPWYKGDFKETMYGSNYPRLLEIKHKHDPDHLFYGFHAVGSDEFHLDENNRLCYDGN